MNTQEQNMIIELATRLRGAQPIAQKDAAAEQLIKDNIANQPEAVYLLTQAVLLQEQAMKQLRMQMDQMQQELNQKQGFFGRLFGSRPTHPSYQQPMTQSAAPSFLGSAMATAAGVAGGMLLFEGIQGLMNPGAEAGAAPLDQGSFTGQDQMLDQGFGAGDNFMDTNNDPLSSSEDDFFGGSSW